MGNRLSNSRFPREHVVRSATTQLSGTHSPQRRPRDLRKTGKLPPSPQRMSTTTAELLILHSSLPGLQSKVGRQASASQNVTPREILHPEPEQESEHIPEPRRNPKHKGRTGQEVFRYIPLYKEEKAEDTFHGRMMTQQVHGSLAGSLVMPLAGSSGRSKPRQGEVGEATPSTRAATPFTPLAHSSLAQSPGQAEDQRVKKVSRRVTTREEPKSYGQLAKSAKCRQVFVSSPHVGRNHLFLDATESLTHRETLISTTPHRAPSALRESIANCQTKRNLKSSEGRSTSVLLPPRTRCSLPVEKSEPSHIVGIPTARKTTKERDFAKANTSPTKLVIPSSTARLAGALSPEPRPAWTTPNTTLRNFSPMATHGRTHKKLTAPKRRPETRLGSMSSPQTPQDEPSRGLKKAESVFIALNAEQKKKRERARAKREAEAMTPLLGAHVVISLAEKKRVWKGHNGVFHDKLLKPWFNQMNSE